MGNHWIFCHFLTASPVVVERQRGRGNNHQKGQEYLLTYIETLLRGFVQFRGLVGWNFCSWCGREALRLEISLHLPAGWKAGDAAAILWPLPKVYALESDISHCQQVEKQLIRISPRAFFWPFFQRGLQQSYLPSQCAGTVGGLCLFSICVASV